MINNATDLHLHNMYQEYSKRDAITQAGRDKSMASDLWSIKSA